MISLKLIYTSMNENRKFAAENEHFCSSLTSNLWTEKEVLMRQFSIGVVGCGNVSNMHFEAYTQHPERLRLAAAFDVLPERVESVKDRFGVEKGYGSLEEMLKDASWEVAVVCTPTSVRQETVKALAAAGKHIFVEKPMADNLDEAEKMVETCESANVKLAVNQNFRYHYPFETARQIIAEGRVGNVITILHQDLMFRQDQGWRTTLPRHGMSIMGIHWFDGFRWMLDEKPVSISAFSASSSAIECKGETDASVQILFEGGCFVSYIESFSSSFNRVETIVIGEKGTLVFSYNGISLYDPQNRKEPVEQWDNPLKGANKPKATFQGINLLLEAIENGNEPLNSGRDNLRTITLLDAAYRSASDQKPVLFNS